MADHRPNVYFSESRGKFIFRASSLSRCIQSLVAAGLNHERMPPPDFMQLAWDEGTHGEAKVLELFRNGGEGWHPKSPALATGADLGNKDGITLRFKALDPHDKTSYINPQADNALYPFVRHELMTTDQVDDEAQFTLEIPVGDRALIRGHLDEISECFQGPIATAADWNGRRFVSEAKLFGKDYFTKWIRKGFDDPSFEMYAWQLSLYMHGTGLPGFFIVGEKKRWEVGDGREESTSESQRYDLDRVHVTLIDTPPIPLGAIKAKVLKLLRMIEAGELPSCDQSQYPCDYYYLCTDKKEVVVKDEVPVVTLEGELATKVQTLAVNYEEAVRGRKAAEKSEKAAKAELEEALTEAGLDRDKPGAWEADNKIVEWSVTERAAEKEPRKGYIARSLKIKAKEEE